MFRKRTTTPMGGSAATDRVPAGLVSLVKTASVSLTKQGLADQRAAVYLVLDHSGSMKRYYSNGSVQHLAEQALGLSANLDDDGTVPVIYFGTHAEPAHDHYVRLDNYQGAISRGHRLVPWGSTNYVAAIEAVIVEHQASGATDPALVIFQTDGEPDDQLATEWALCDAARLPIYWAFVGFGPARAMTFLQTVDTLTGRLVDNTGFFHAADPKAVTDADLYDGITRGYAAWLRDATAAGIVR